MSQSAQLPLESDERVDVLFFEIGMTTYGADASQVLRIDRALEGDLVLSALGPLTEGKRALVFLSPEGERHLKVDFVNGVRPIPTTDLRRLPPLTGAPAFTIGLCLTETKPVLLIDLVQTVALQGRA